LRNVWLEESIVAILGGGAGFRMRRDASVEEIGQSLRSRM
jgi:hypothetical protein